jgi:hypothetical protein
MTIRLDEPACGQQLVRFPALQVESRLHPLHVRGIEHLLLHHIAQGVQAGRAEAAVRRQVALRHDDLAEGIHGDHGRLPALGHGLVPVVPVVVGLGGRLPAASVYNKGETNESFCKNASLVGPVGERTFSG